MMRMRNRAFTMIELLVVVAITGVLLTLIIVPMIQAFNMTRTAQGFSDAQAKARSLIEQISREIGNGAAVRDNTGVAGQIAVTVPSRAGGISTILLPYMKLDVVKPAEGDPARGPSGAFVNPNTGKEDPTLRAPKGQVVLPVTPGSTIVRYFVGRVNPFQDYNNPYDGLLMQRSGTRDNMYVLRRAEIEPFLFDRNQGVFVPNTDLFEVDGSGRIVLDDPSFFLPNRNNAGIVSNDAKATRIRQWLNRSVVMTEISRYDMIQPVFDRRSREVVYDGDVPRINGLIQFRPARVSREAAQGMQAVRLGEESEGADRMAPDVFRTEFGAWTSSLVRIWPEGWDRGNASANEYLVGRTGIDVPGFSIFAFDPDSGQTEERGGTELFDVNAYETAASTGLRYPFVQAIVAANGRSGWLGSPTLRQLFVPYFTDNSSGKLFASFGISEVGNPNLNPPIGNPQNLPGASTGPELSPQNDPNASGNSFGPAESVNLRFNKVWSDNPQLRPDVHRFIDLRVVPCGDGTDSPLHPDPTRGFPRASLVPGSEEVFGPDQNSGPNYGQLVRYTRSARTPGPNQYRLNYVNLPEPADYGLLGVPNPPANYDPNNFVSAVIQPRFRAGYLQLNSDPNVPLPTGQVLVSYRFQFTRTRDVVSVDYDTRQLMSVLLTVKNHPQTSFPNAQSVTLTSTATVRNYLR
jgi:prepilin-type N-terminal cleavage/methylation domain-containing protein